LIDKLQFLCSSEVFRRSEKVVPRIFKVEQSGGRITAYVRGSVEPEIHTVSINTRGEYFCSCRGFLAHPNRLCSHLVGLLRKLEMEGEDISPYVKGLLGFGDMSVEMVETSLKGYNRLFGGLCKRRINAVFGKPEMGKSLLNLQFAVDVVSREGGNALIVETEGGLERRWLSYFKDRNPELQWASVEWPVFEDVKRVSGSVEKQVVFDYDDLKFEKREANTIYVWECRTLLPILAFHGRPLYFKMKGGVIEPVDVPEMMVSLRDSPVGRLIEECNLKYLSYDSLSTPIESEFTGGQSNWRTRAKTTFALLNKVQQVLDSYDVVAMLTVHATQGGFEKPRPVGGKALLHNSKFVAYLTSFTARSGRYAGSRSLRKLQVYRHPLKEKWSEEAAVVITDRGFVDV